MTALITINQLEMSTIIGTYAFERRLKQTLVLNVQFEVQASHIAKTDDINLSKAVDYEKLSQSIVQFGKDNDFFLLETLGEKLADYLLKAYTLSWIKLEITKPLALKNAKGITLSICRPCPLPA